jgi:YggT family protein
MTAAVLAAAGVTSVLRDVLYLYLIVLFGRAVLSWFPISPGTPLETIARILERLTEPVLRPIRRLLPPVRMGGMALDLSFIVVVVVLFIVISAL